MCLTNTITTPVSTSYDDRPRVNFNRRVYTNQKYNRYFYKDPARRTIRNVRRRDLDSNVGDSIVLQKRSLYTNQTRRNKLLNRDDQKRSNSTIPPGMTV